MTGNGNDKTPKLFSIEIAESLDTANKLFVNLSGEKFEPETVQIRVIGAGCIAALPCLVPNSALTKHSSISEIRLENVPLTLPNGDFYLYVQNGVSAMSNSVVLNVP